MCAVIKVLRGSIEVALHNKLEFMVPEPGVRADCRQIVGKLISDTLWAMRSAPRHTASCSAQESCRLSGLPTLRLEDQQPGHAFLWCDDALPRSLLLPTSLQKEDTSRHPNAQLEELKLEPLKVATLVKGDVTWMDKNWCVREGQGRARRQELWLWQCSL